jgi:hypothetical protein
MKKTIKPFVAALLLATACSAMADVHYVDVNSTNAVTPYLSWATAATNIQAAVDAAVAGDEIVVTNGIYATGGRSGIRVTVDKPLRVRSVNGPRFTSIAGSGPCVYLTNVATLSGFTLTNGAYGVICESLTAVVSNCVIVGNHAFASEVGPPVWGGGANGGTLNNCTLSGNSGFLGGGAANCILNYCTLIGNVAHYYSSSGGGRGGGAYRCTLNNCALSGNMARPWNQVTGCCGEGGGAYDSTLNNCTLSDNWASWGGGGAMRSTLNNCIAYFNTAGNYRLCTLNYSCTTPLPTDGVGNITNEPAFVNLAAGNYRLRRESPCIDAGTNLSASITADLDGRTRPLDGNGDGLAAFDMGAYEYRTPLLVWQDSTNATPPYTSWATAATNIQDAVDAAVAGDEIVVTNGVYATGGPDGNRVAVDKPLRLRSVNGPQFTTIDGAYSVRCVSLASAVSLSGFTLTNGRAHYGAGLFCESTNTMVSNCVVSGNSVSVNVYVPRNQTFVMSISGGGAYGGTLNDCILSGNHAFAFVSGFGVAEVFARGGGTYGCIVNNCALTGNDVGAQGCCENSYFDAYGGGAFRCTLNNCTLTGNSASAGDAGGAAAECVLNNCTLTGNSAYSAGGASGSTLNNCIVYFNTAPQEPNYNFSTLNYSCTTPQPTTGVGNITNAPLFIDQAPGNLHLQSTSPCINAGWNAFAAAGPDLDGNPRIVGGTVDMGAYEYQSLDLISFGVVSNQFGFNVTGQSNWFIILETSSDFTNWTPVTTNTLNGSPFPFHDATSPILPQRFYRARLQ